MRIATSISPVRAVALLPRARVGEGREEGATVPALAQLAVTPVQATAAYLPKPSAAFEGLNYRDLA